MDTADRPATEARWLELAREILPAAAPARRWPVRADHCFQRIFLDNACEGVWYDRVPRRPAYAYADRVILDKAVALAEAALTGDADIVELNRRSLAWRQDRKSKTARTQLY